MGGGFGGCVLCLVDTDAIPALLDSLQEAYQAAFGINLKAYPVELAEGASVVAD
jgi:galactokinase